MQLAIRLSDVERIERDIMETEHIFHADMKRNSPTIVSGSGIYMYDDKGNKFIDASSGPILASLGYGLDEMGEVLKKQCGEINFAYRTYAVTPAYKKACKYISEISGGVIDKTILTSGGTEAVELAAKIARIYHLDKGDAGKYKVIGRWISYHGISNSALSWGGHLERRKSYKPYMQETGHIPPPYCYRCWFGKEPASCLLECAKALEQEILTQGPEEVSAFIAEPVSGNALCGNYPKKEGYYKLIREICDKYDVLFIMDEVMSGIGRTGFWFAFQQFEVKPDIVTMGKALGGGYFPVGGVGCGKKITETIENGSAMFPAGYSWAGNPLAAAVVVKTIEYKKEHNLIEHVKEMGDYLGAKLDGLMEKHPTIGNVIGKGLFYGIELVKDKQTKEPFPRGANYAARVVDECEKNFMFVQSGTGNVKGTAGDMLLVGPAFIVTKQQIDDIVNILDISIGGVSK